MADDDLRTMGAAARSAPSPGAPRETDGCHASRDAAPRGTVEAGRWQRRLVVIALVLAALNLRPAITSLGALLADVRDGLGMSGTVAGLLTSMPAACFAAFGVAAPRLARRWGPGAVVCAGLVAITAGLAVRPFAGGTVVFLLASALALAGIAVSNVLMPVIVKRWFPDQVGRMTGLYSMALSLGTAVAAALTVPATHALGVGWRSGLGMWAVLGAVAVLPWLAVAGGRTGVAAGPAQGDARGGGRSAGTGAGPATEPVRSGAAPEAEPGGAAGSGGAADLAPAAGPRTSSRPEAASWSASATASRAASGADSGARISRSPTAWAMAVFFGLQSTGAYITMGWMPQIFRDAGVSASTAGVLLAITMVMGVPLAFVLPQVAARLPTQGPLVVLLGAAGLAGYAGLWLAPAGGCWAWALLLGIANCAFPLALTMISMRARTGPGVVRLSAFAQSTGYLLSIPGPLLVGALYQHSGGWHQPLVLMAGLLVPQTVTGVLAGRNRTVEDEV